MGEKMKEGRIFAQKLSYKEVLDSEGREMGVLHNIVADAETGILTRLVIEPASGLDTGGFKKENDYILIPFDAVKSVRDVIILDSERVKTRA